MCIPRSNRKEVANRKLRRSSFYYVPACYDCVRSRGGWRAYSRAAPRRSADTHPWSCSMHKEFGISYFVQRKCEVRRLLPLAKGVTATEADLRLLRGCTRAWPLPLAPVTGAPASEHALQAGEPCSDGRRARLRLPPGWSSTATPAGLWQLARVRFRPRGTAERGARGPRGRSSAHSKVPRRPRRGRLGGSRGVPVLVSLARRV